MIIIKAVNKLLSRRDHRLDITKFGGSNKKMSNKSIQNILILGLLAILGGVFIQAYWVMATWDLKDDEFDSSVRISLRKTAESLATFNNSRLPKQNIIQKRSSNTYVVNINDVIDAKVLEDYLIQNFEKRSIDADFEYGIYDCSSDEMVYGNYCDIGSRNKETSDVTILPKFKELEYYFVVRFPSKTGHILSNMKQALLFTFTALLAILFFIYAVFVILRQRRFSEMQRDFINNMTHEFKTPIASIKLAASSIAKDKYVEEDVRLAKFAEIIDEQSTRLNQQVEKLLNAAALEKKNLDLQLEDINLQSLLGDISEDFEMRVRDVKGEFIFTAVEEPVIVKADRVHLTNVLYSLLDNAVKYSKETVEIRLTLERNYIEIADKGIGISKDHIGRIFKKFYRVPTGNVHDVKGFGLGLYYVKTIINKLGWNIVANSELEKGTTILLKF